ncbi:Asp23/Gls24 family envelope stress response protein [Nocardia paucivorans]|uniref:Asp23/Gls24 family envelope stress response protein n=1 Tax=Nocardia paucivorans TaxID=114259 RepID=UPI00030D77B6|nr:Asp23/Gls24 family envelope stress response protein [Nocardia paucivorans]
MTAGPLTIVVEPPVVAVVAAMAVAAVPGVARPEPGTRGLVSSVPCAGRRHRRDIAPASPEGVWVRRGETGLLVQVDIAIVADRSAVEVGRAVQEEVTRVVWEQTGQRVAEVWVTVLDIAPEVR